MPICIKEAVKAVLHKPAAKAVLHKPAAKTSRLLDVEYFAPDSSHAISSSFPDISRTASKKVKKAGLKRPGDLHQSILAQWNMHVLHVAAILLKTCRRKYFPKTNVPKGIDTHPVSFPSIQSTFKWAFVFLKRAAEAYGNQFMFEKLAAWKWDLSTCFSGVGCAEMVVALEVSQTLCKKIKFQHLMWWRIKLVVLPRWLQRQYKCHAHYCCCWGSPEPPNCCWPVPKPSWSTSTDLRARTCCFEIQLRDWQELQDSPVPNSWAIHRWDTLPFSWYHGAWPSKGESILLDPQEDVLLQSSTPLQTNLT